jgi:hypothetical protein
MGLEKAAFVAATVRQPSLYCQRPETLDANATRSAALLGLEKAAFVAAAVKQSQLFHQRPDRLNEYATRSAALIGVDKAIFVAAALKQPSLFYQRPETLAVKFTYVAAIAGTRNTASLTAAALIQRTPAALCYSTRHLHLRYILAKAVNTKGSLLSLLSLSSAKAEALAVSHFADRPRTLQVMRAAGLIRTPLPDLKEIPRYRDRSVALQSFCSPPNFSLTAS